MLGFKDQSIIKSPKLSKMNFPIKGCLAGLNSHALDIPLMHKVPVNKTCE